MGLFINNNLPLRHFNEVEVDGQPVDPEAEPAADYTGNDDAGAEPPPEEQQGQEANPEEQPPEDQGGEPQGDEPVDYTDMPEGDAPPEDGGAPEGNGGGQPPTQEQPEAEVDDLKQKEEEMYADLTPEQLDIKHKELKNRFLEMYDIVVAAIERVGDASVCEENIGTVEFVSNQLSDLKDMLTDYVNDVYKTKSYIENSINYNRFIAVLNGISKVLEEMNSKNDQK